MSSKTIYDGDFKFDNLSINELRFGDGSIQTTGYLGNSPIPRQTVYPITTSTILNCNNNLTAVSTSNFQIVNLYTVYMGGLYFQDTSNNNLSSVNVVFSNSYNGNIQIQLLNDISLHPIITTSAYATFLNNANGVITFGDITINNNGSVVANFPNVQIVFQQPYTITFFTIPYI
jgi:hypothetical protein